MNSVIHFAGALALVLALAMLCQVRLVSALWCGIGQSVCVTLTLALQGVGQAVVAAVALVLSAVLMPLWLERRRDLPAAPALGLAGRLICAGALVVIALALGPHLAGGPDDMLVCLAAALVLLGLLQAGTAGGGNLSVLGFLAAQNGALFLAAILPDPPFLVLAMVAVPVVPVLVAASQRLPHRAGVPL